MKANKTMRGQAVSNHRRKDRESESNIDSAAHNQIPKKKKKTKKVMAGITTWLSILH
jgi:hypothetical protein